MKLASFSCYKIVGITYLRVRGMWGIENPFSVFNYAYTRDYSKRFNFMCIINNCKFNSFKNKDELYTLAEKTDNLRIRDIDIKDPDNPAKLKESKLITFVI